jgi:hypothetical protein
MKPEKTETILDFDPEQLCELVRKLQRRVRASIEGDEIRAARLRTILSLVDVATFLDQIGAGQDVVNHFANLANVFHDLNRGALPPIAVPAPSKGNRPQLSPLWEVRCIVALGVDVLMRAGMTQKEAVEIAVTHHGLKRLLTKSDANLRGSIKAWHDKAKQADTGGDDINPLAHAVFELSHMWDSIGPDSNYDQAGRHLLRHAVERAKRL